MVGRLTVSATQRCHTNNCPANTRPFDRTGQSPPIRRHQGFLGKKDSHFVACSSSTNRLKLPRYSSSLTDKFGRSKTERIFKVTSVSCLECGSNETTPDINAFESARHAIRRPGI